MNGPTMERILEAFRDYWAHVQDSPIDEIEAFIPMAYERLALIGADLETSEIVMRPYEDRLFKERAARSRKQRPRCKHEPRMTMPPMKNFERLIEERDEETLTLACGHTTAAKPLQPAGTETMPAPKPPIPGLDYAVCETCVQRIAASWRNSAALAARKSALKRRGALTLAGERRPRLLRVTRTQGLQLAVQTVYSREHAVNHFRAA